MNVTKNLQIGLLSATFLVTSNMLGSGVYMLPSTLANIGGISIVGFLLTMIGVMAIALVFAKLATIIPSGAGIYAYTKEAFGDYAAYQVNFIYTLANWVGLASMLTIVVGYLGHIFNLFNNPLVGALTQIVVIWMFTIINIKGARVAGFFQTSAFIIALIPLLFVALVGWKWFNLELFMSSWNVSHSSSVSAINSSFNNIMWAFIGIESACVSARLIQNPKRNIPIATIFGVILATLIYIASCTVIMGVVPNKELAHSSSPFADTFAIMFHSRFSGILMSIIAIIDCLGAMVGWTLVTGQTIQAAANDGLAPKFFAKTNAKNMPVRGLMTLAIAMSIVVIATISPTSQEQFNKIITMSVILYLISYIYAIFSIIAIARKNKGLNSDKYLLYVILAIIASSFCMYSIFSSDKVFSLYAFLTLMLSSMFYAFKASR